MNFYKHYMYVFLLCIGIPLAAQENTTETKSSFSLEEAKAYALEHNATVKNAGLDVIAAQKKIVETRATGLPQASAKFNYQYMLSLSGSVEDFGSFGGLFKQINDMSYYLAQVNSNHVHKGLKPDEFIVEPVDEESMKKTITLDFTVSQLIFSGEYIVGLQASRTYKRLSEEMFRKSKTDVIELVTNSYYTLLIAEENLRIADSSFMSMSHVLDETQQLFEKGFVEDTDVDQLKLVVSQLKNSVRMLENQLALADKLLKFQLGIDFNQQISLSDKLDGLMGALDFDKYLATAFNLDQNVDYKLLQTQEDLMKLDLKRYKSQYLPTVSGFYQHQENFNESAFSFTPPDLVGLSVEVPIFNSGLKMAKVSQARIELEKAQNNKEQNGRGIELSYYQALSDYKTALDNYENKKENMELAGRIAHKTVLKFREGVSSGIDVGQMQSQYLQAQGEFYQSIYNLISIQSNLDKILTKN